MNSLKNDSKFNIFILCLLMLLTMLLIVVVIDYSNLEEIKYNKTNIIKEDTTENIDYKEVSKTKRREELDILYEYSINSNEKIVACASDYAMGTVAVQIYKSEDGGNMFSLVTENQDGYVQVSANAEYIFYNKDIGFISSPTKSGNAAELYITRNGGKTFELLEFPEQELEKQGEVDLKWKDVYDYYEIPILEEDNIAIFVSQGNDGDYKGGKTAALYISNDMGKSFKYMGVISI